MKTFILFFFIILILKISQENNDEEIVEHKIGLDLSNEDIDVEGNDYEDYLRRRDEKMKSLVNEYILQKKWNQEQQIDRKAFIDMFHIVIQKSPIKQGNTKVLNKFALKTIQKYGEPIYVKNLQQYYNLKGLNNIYIELFSPDVNSDINR